MPLNALPTHFIHVFLGRYHFNSHALHHWHCPSHFNTTHMNDEWLSTGHITHPLLLASSQPLQCLSMPHHLTLFMSSLAGTTPMLSAATPNSRALCCWHCPSCFNTTRMNDEWLCAGHVACFYLLHVISSQYGWRIRLDSWYQLYIACVPIAMILTASPYNTASDDHL